MVYWKPDSSVICESWTEWRQYSSLKICCWAVKSSCHKEWRISQFAKIRLFIHSKQKIKQKDKYKIKNTIQYKTWAKHCTSFSIHMCTHQTLLWANTAKVTPVYSFLYLTQGINTRHEVMGPLKFYQ
jgi:hypothetical protein